MSDFLALGGTIALWLAISFALWLGRRFWIRSGQDKRLGHAASAAELARGASAVFDAIRTPSAPDEASADLHDYLRRETHALLNRIQQQGDYFDQVNSQRVKIQAVIGVEDHKGLSDILDLRRDLWATSEIILVEDPAQFGRTFADEGAFERFRAEAVRTLFKLPELAEAGEDVIDLRIALAIREAESFEADLAAAIAEARERDRLPTPAELAAYPVAWVKTIPVAFAACAAFARAFYAHASEMSRRIRSSERVAQGKARMRQMSEDWPQRLSDGFQRATESARENASSLREHYDFLAAAHDFRGKYQNLIQRAPELSDRSRQFIARLELAERSERLRLTSANAAIWTMRKAVDGLAHAIAFLRSAHAGLQGTAPYALAAAALAPAPVRGRRVPAFRSYRRALAANGLREPVSGPVILIAEEPKPPDSADRKKAAAAKTSRRKTAKRQDARKTSQPRRTIRERLMAAVRPAAKPAQSAKVAKKPPPAAAKPVKQVAAVKPAPKTPSEIPAKQIRATPDSPQAKPGALAEPSGMRKSPSGELRGLFSLFGRSAASKKTAEKAKAPPPRIKIEREAEKAADVAAALPPLPPKTQLGVSAQEKPAKAAKPSRHIKTPKAEKPSAPVIAKADPPAKKIEAAAPDKPETHPETVGRHDKSIPAVAALVEEQKANGSDDRSALKASKQHEQEVTVEPDHVEAVGETVSEISTGPAIAVTDDATAGAKKNGSFLGRLFGRRKAADDVQDSQYAEQIEAETWSADAEDDAAAEIEEAFFEDPIEAPVRLLDKLSSLDKDGDLKLFDDVIEADEDEDTGTATGDADAAEGDPDDFEPLTQSLMELQVRMKSQAPQIKAFPWLRH